MRSEAFQIPALICVVCHLGLHVLPESDTVVVNATFDRKQINSTQIICQCFAFYYFLKNQIVSSFICLQIKHIFKLHYPTPLLRLLFYLDKWNPIAFDRITDIFQGFELFHQILDSDETFLWDLKNDRFRPSETP